MQLTNPSLVFHYQKLPLLIIIILQSLIPLDYLARRSHHHVTR
jgi:hypothetical protein